MFELNLPQVSVGVAELIFAYAIGELPLRNRSAMAGVGMQ